MRMLLRSLQILQPSFLVAVGKYAEDCARRCAGGMSGVTIGRILHPSPASPMGNGRGEWEGIAAQQLRDIGVELPPRREDAIDEL